MKSVPKLTAHKPVDDKIDCAIYKRQYVHYFAELSIAVLIEGVAQDATKKSQNTLWKFGNEEKKEDRE